MEREVMKRERRPNGQFAKGQGGPGRRRGQPNKITRTLREAVMLAGELVGSDGKGKDGLTGYIANVARRDPKSYMALLARFVPVDLNARIEPPEQRQRSTAEIRADLLARGINADALRDMADGFDKAQEHEQPSAFPHATPPGGDRLN